MWRCRQRAKRAAPNIKQPNKISDNNNNTTNKYNNNLNKHNHTNKSNDNDFPDQPELTTTVELPSGFYNNNFRFDTAKDIARAYNPNSIPISTDDLYDILNNDVVCNC